MGCAVTEGGPVYAVGQPYNQLRRRWPEGARYTYRGSQHELILFFRQPSAREVRAVGQGRAEFALVAEGPLLVLLYQFRPPPEHLGAPPSVVIPWSEAPYTWHRVPLDERTLPEPATDPEQRALLTLLLVDADTGIIRALRALTFSPAFSAELEEAIREQAQLPYDAATYERLQAGLEARYPSTEALLAVARARCVGGA